MNDCAMKLIVAASLASTPGASPDVNQLPVQHQLPDPLVMFDGTPVTSAQQWREQRRPELIALFEHYMYGQAPPAPDNLRFTVDDVDDQALNGKATRKLITLHFGPEGTPPVSLLLVVPNERTGPAPVFLGLNFVGNHTVMDDPAIPLTKAWVNNAWSGGTDNRAHENQRNIRAYRWQIEKAIDRGYAVATMYAGEISPDDNGRFREGVHRGYLQEGQERPGPHEWGVIAAWVWGLHRGVDYLVADEDVDSERIIVIGHSRLGKTALLAAALDERIAIAIPSQAGCGGTAPSRTDVGERVHQINSRFPHWFNDIFKKFNQQVERLPFDQHCLIALVAPRPVLLTNASDDGWANPQGQFEMLIAASPVYELLGVEGLTQRTFPPAHQLITSRLGYFIRPGKHDMTATEWQAWIDFADTHLGGEAR